MAVYRYKCKECGDEREEIQSIAEGEEFLATARCAAPIVYDYTEGDQCGGFYERLIGGTSFKLAGRGWFKDSYR